MRKVFLPLLALALAAGAASARADVIAADGSVVANTVPPPGNAGYIFYAFNGSGNTSSLPSYASVADASGTKTFGGSGDGYSTLTVGNATGNTGVLYHPNSSGSITENLATITLGGTVPASFRIGLLGNNSGGSNNTAYTITSSNGGAATTVNSPAPSSSTPVNDFFFATVTGATVGETITISGTAFQPTLGGITFDSVPEPATLGILALGGIGLLAKKRRKVA